MNMLTTQHVLLLYLYITVGYIIPKSTSQQQCYTEGGIRLVGGRVSSEGRVEVCVNGTWGTVCDKNGYWTAVDAQVVCWQLGYYGYGALSGHNLNYFELGTGPIVLGNVRCNGSEYKLIDCTYDEHTTACDHNHDVAVRCHDVCSVHGDLRLVGGRAPSEGRVEVCVNGAWGTVCDDYSYSTAEYTNVICRQLGYHGGRKSSYFDPGTGLIVIELSFYDPCDGLEQKLINCSHTILPRYCSHSRDIAVSCQDQCSSDGDLRLVDERTYKRGRVEVCLNGQWGTVCDDHWDVRDTQVVCRQLGYHGGSSYSFQQAGTGPIWLDDVQCVGSEQRLIDCLYTHSHNCSHFKDTGVRCYCRYNDIRIDSQGFVEICLSNQWYKVTTGSAYTLGIEEARVICRQLRRESHSPLLYINDSGSEYHRSSLINVTCYGFERQLQSCRYYSARFVYERSTVGISCYSTPASPTSILTTAEADSNLTVKWNAPTEHLTLISAYEVSCQALASNVSHPTGGMTLTTRTTASYQSVTITGVLPNTTYQCCVRSVVTDFLSLPTCVNAKTHSQGVYSNSPFQILFTAPMTCGELVQEVSEDERERLESAISGAISERCGCSFSQHNIKNGFFVCSEGPSANTVVFRGRLISSSPDTDSVEFLFYLQEWLLTEPTIALGGISLRAAENCRVYYKEAGNTTHAIPCEWPLGQCRDERQSITGAAASAVLLALVAVTTLVVMVMMCFYQRYKVHRKLIVDEVVSKRSNNKREDDVPTHDTRGNPNTDGKERQTQLGVCLNDRNPNKAQMKGAQRKRSVKQQISGSDGKKIIKDRKKGHNNYDKAMMTTSMTVDWNTHCLLKKLSDKRTGDEAAATAVREREEDFYEEIKQDPEGHQTDEHTYQPLVPPKLLRAGEWGGGEASPYQDLTYNH